MYEKFIFKYESKHIDQIPNDKNYGIWPRLTHGIFRLSLSHGSVGASVVDGLWGAHMGLLGAEMRLIRSFRGPLGRTVGVNLKKITYYSPLTSLLSLRIFQN